MGVQTGENEEHRRLLVHTYVCVPIMVCLVGVPSIKVHNIPLVCYVLLLIW